MKIKLSEDKKTEFTGKLISLFQDEFDLDLSEFRAGEVLQLCTDVLCPAIYNQAVQDVRDYMQTKLDDLDGEIYVDP
ncbi:MAG: DUF2164 domain-containing protein [Hyphomicrobiales bacterium]